MDAMESVGWVRVTKRDKETGEVVYDKWHKNTITNYAMQQCALMWTGVMPQVPSQIAVGTGTGYGNGTQASDTYLWSEFSGSRKQVDYAETWLNYYTQYSVTYQSTEVLGAMLNWNDPEYNYPDNVSAANFWTTNSGTINWSYSGATIGTTGAYMTSKQAVNMDPSSVGVTTVTQAMQIASSNVTSNFVRLWQSNGNYYEIALIGKNIKLAKIVGGVRTTFATSVDLTVGPINIIASGSWVTLGLTLDASGNLTGFITQNINSDPTQWSYRVQATDTALPGPYSLMVGGDVNTILQYASATYPNQDPLEAITLTEAGLFDASGNLWSHVALTGVTHDNTSTLSIQWQILHMGN